jgi:pentatricopeptide repeat protein
MPFAPDTFTYNPLIRALCFRRRVLDALAVFDDMLLRAGRGDPRRDARQGLRTRQR